MEIPKEAIDFELRVRQRMLDAIRSAETLHTTRLVLRNVCNRASLNCKHCPLSYEERSYSSKLYGKKLLLSRGCSLDDEDLFETFINEATLQLIDQIGKLESLKSGDINVSDL